MIGAEPQYIIDSNIFMEASRRYYQIDFAKPFWEGLCVYARQGKIISIDKVLHEIRGGNDMLATWAQTDFISHFKSCETLEILETYGGLMRWASAISI